MDGADLAYICGCFKLFSNLSRNRQLLFEHLLQITTDGRGFLNLIDKKFGGYVAGWMKRDLPIA